MRVSRRTFASGFISTSLFLLRPAWALDEVAKALNDLKTVPFFAWGGIGFAGTTSTGESALRLLVRGPAEETAKRLETLYASATPSGRLYILLGLRDLAPARFELLLPKALLSVVSVTKMQGCIMSSDVEGNLAHQISTGLWGLNWPSAEPSQKHGKTST